MEKLKISIITFVKNGMPYLSEAISRMEYMNGAVLSASGMAAITSCILQCIFM